MGLYNNYEIKYEKLIDITVWDKKFNGINNHYVKGYKHISAEQLKKFDNPNGSIKLMATGLFDGMALEDECKEFINEGEIITMPSGGTANIKYYKGKFLDSGNLIATSKNEELYNTKYIYYCLMNMQQTIQSYYRGSGVKHPDMNNILNLEIAVPPLEVQCEIVHILDDFTLLSAELSAELKARQKQYEYYKNKLLKNYDEIDNCSLCDVSEYSKERISAELLNDDNYIGVDNLLQNKMGKTTSTHTPTTGNSTKYVENDILIGNIRPYLKKIWFSDRIGGTNGDVLAIHITSDNVVPEYLYYILSSDKFFDYDNSNSKGAKMPRGNKEAVMKYRFYLPKKEEQIRIVKLLNNFEKICNNMTLGIPAEIEKRQKQYEYYRDKLLSFKEVEVNE